MNTELDRLLEGKGAKGASSEGASRDQAAGGITLPVLVVSMLLSALLGGACSYWAAQRLVAKSLMDSSRIRVVDVPALAMSGVRPGDPDSGVRHAQAVVDHLVGEGYVVLHRAAVVDAPASQQVPAATR